MSSPNNACFRIYPEPDSVNLTLILKHLNIYGNPELADSHHYKCDKQMHFLTDYKKCRGPKNKNIYEVKFISKDQLHEDTNVDRFDGVSFIVDDAFDEVSKSNSSTISLKEYAKKVHSKMRAEDYDGYAIVYTKDLYESCCMKKNGECDKPVKPVPGLWGHVWGGRKSRKRSLSKRKYSKNKRQKTNKRKGRRIRRYKTHRKR